METTSLKMLDELLGDDSDRLSAWECEFIDSLDKQRRIEGFSPKQEAKLSEVWRRVFG